MQYKLQKLPYIQHLFAISVSDLHTLFCRKKYLCTFWSQKEFAHTFFVAKTIYSIFYRKNDLRTLSGKFLRVENCHPESSDCFRNFRQSWQFRFCTDFRTVVFLVNGVSKNTYSLYTFTIAPRGI